MSRAKQLADEEADRVEEEDEDLEGEQPDDQGEEDAPAAETNVDADAIARAEQLIAEHKLALAEILGDDMVRYDCILCSGLGYLPDLPPPFTLIEVVPTDEGLALDIKSPGLAQRYPQAPDKEPCPECEATGFTETGSKNPNALTAPCSKCGGNGWVTKARDAPPLVFDHTSNVSAATLSNGPQAPMPDDAWGRKYDHAHYGIPPSMIGADGRIS